MSVSVTGDKAILRALSKLEGKDQKKAIRKATRAGTKHIASAVKDKLPKRTGALRKSIKVRSMKRSRVRQGTTVVSQGPYYLPFVEWGTARMEAQKNMKIAEEKSRDKAMDTSLETLSNEIGVIWRSA